MKKIEKEEEKEYEERERSGAGHALIAQLDLNRGKQSIKRLWARVFEFSKSPKTKTKTFATFLFAGNCLKLVPLHRVEPAFDADVLKTVVRSEKR